MLQRRRSFGTSLSCSLVALHGRRRQALWHCWFQSPALRLILLSEGGNHVSREQTSEFYREWPRIFGAIKRYIDVIEDRSRGNAARSIGGEHQVVPWAAGVLSSETVDEGERMVELLGANQKASAIRRPIVQHGLRCHPSGEEDGGNLRFSNGRNLPGQMVCACSNRRTTRSVTGWCEITRVGLLAGKRCGESTRVSQGGQFHMFGAVGKNTTEDFVQSRTSSNTFSNRSEGA